MTGTNRGSNGGSIFRRFALLAGMMGMTLFLMGSGCPTPTACEVDADCDDGDLCTVNTCVDGACVTEPVECPEGFECDPDTGDCSVCLTDEACDDGDACTTNACIEGECEVVAVVECEEGEICDPDTGECVECLDDEDCAEGEVCEENVCVPAPVECETDDDCDDGDLCTINTCDDGECVTVPVECPEGEFCDPDTGACTPIGGDFVFTLEQDTFTGTPGDDVFTASVGTLQAWDIAVGNGGYDVLNAVVAGATASEATLIDIDEVNFQTLNNVRFDALNTAAIGMWSIAAGSTGNLTLENVQDEEAGFGIAAGVARRLTVDQSGGDGVDMTEATLYLNGTALGAAFEYIKDNDDLPLLNIDVMGDNFLTNREAGPGAGFFGDVDEVVITGGSSLNLADVTPGSLNAVPTPIDASAFTGDLILWLGAEAATDAFDFSDGGAEQVLGISQIIITEEATNYELTFDADAGPIAIDIMLEEGETAGYLEIFDLEGTLNVTLGGDGGGCDDIWAVDIDVLNIVSTGTTDNEIDGDVEIEYDGTGFDPTVVNISGDQDLEITGDVTANQINAAGFTGNLTVIGTPGLNNLFTSGAGVDTFTGNGGDNRFRFPEGSTGVATAADCDTITDFVTTDDTIAFGGPVGAVGNYDESNVAVADYAAALAAANTAMNGTIRYVFRYEAGPIGYLFFDRNGDGTADECVILDGADHDDIAFGDIVAW